MTASLRVLGFSTADDLSAARLDAVRQAEPGLVPRVEPEPLDHDAVLAAIGAGDVPDVLYLDRDDIGAYAARNAILPVHDWLARDAPERRFRDAPLAAVTFRGATWGIPEFHDVHVLYLHSAALYYGILQAKDVEFGDWVALPHANREMTHRPPKGVRRVGIDTGLPELLPVWAKANNANLVSPDGRTALLDDPRIAEVLQVALRMIDVQGGWHAVSAHRDRLDYFGPENPFAADQIGGMVMPASYIDVLAEQTPYLEYVVKPVIDRFALPISWSHGMAWAVPHGAADPEASWRFIRAISAPETWLAGARARMVAAKAEERRFEPLFTADKDADIAIWSSVYEPSGQNVVDLAVQAVRAIQETGFVVPPNAASREVRAAWMRGVRRVLRGEARPAEAMGEANRVAQAALDAAG